jgi:hypothetical protein
MNAGSGMGSRNWAGCAIPALFVRLPPHLRRYATDHGTVGSLTKTINRWTFKFGGEYRVYLSTVYSPKVGIDFGGATSVVQPLVSYTRQTMNAAGTPIGVANTDQAGNGAASMLLGAGQIGIWSSNGAATCTDRGIVPSGE